MTGRQAWGPTGTLAANSYSVENARYWVLAEFGTSWMTKQPRWSITLVDMSTPNWDTLKTAFFMDYDRDEIAAIADDWLANADTL